MSAYAVAGTTVNNVTTFGEPLLLIGDVGNVFTNELVDEINQFDRAAVIQQAREFKL